MVTEQASERSFFGNNRGIEPCLKPLDVSRVHAPRRTCRTRCFLLGSVTVGAAALRDQKPTTELIDRCKKSCSKHCFPPRPRGRGAEKAASQPPPRQPHSRERPLRSRPALRTRRACRPWRCRSGSCRTSACPRRRRTPRPSHPRSGRSPRPPPRRSRCPCRRREVEALPDQRRVHGGVADALLRDHAAVDVGADGVGQAELRRPRQLDLAALLDILQCAAADREALPGAALAEAVEHARDIAYPRHRRERVAIAESIAQAVAELRADEPAAVTRARALAAV